MESSLSIGPNLLNTASGPLFVRYQRGEQLRTTEGGARPRMVDALFGVSPGSPLRHHGFRTYARLFTVGSRRVVSLLPPTPPKAFAPVRGIPPGPPRTVESTHRDRRHSLGYGHAPDSQQRRLLRDHSWFDRARSSLWPRTRSLETDSLFLCSLTLVKAGMQLAGDLARRQKHQASEIAPRCRTECPTFAPQSENLLPESSLAPGPPRWESQFQTGSV